MTEAIHLDAYLARWSGEDSTRRAVAEALVALATACSDIAARAGHGPLAGELGAAVGSNSDGDTQKMFDVWANDRVLEVLAPTPVAAVASEELDAPVVLNPGAPIVVAVDPLDGSSNIEINIAIGTIFAILPAIAGDDPVASFLQPGSAMLAAGYAIYGPSTAFVISVGAGVAMFTLDPATRAWLLTRDHVAIRRNSNEYAINASNYRHWSLQVRTYIDDCILGTEGPREADVNMRWIAALVADCHRILTRGGVYLYPRDAREGYQNGRLRLVYEVNPVAFLIEQAGGKAFDGRERVLDIKPSSVHCRAPIIFGSADEVDRVARYKAEPGSVLARAPLFHRRGLLRL